MPYSSRSPLYTQGPDGLPDPDLAPDFYSGVNAKRLFAWGIDMAIVAALTALAVLGTFFLGLFILPLIWVSIDAAYRVVTLARGSATPGMRLMGLELRDRTGRRFDLAHAGLHTLGYYLSISVFPAQIVSIVLMLTGARKQGLTDMILGTAAINRPADSF